MISDQNYTPFLGRSIGVLSVGMECPMEGVENDYRLISGYFGGIEFGGLQEELLRIAT